MKCICTSVGQPHCKSCGCLNNPNKPGHRSNGDICANTVVPGTHRCHMHGGSTPVAQLKAAQSMALLRMPVIEGMHEVLEAMMQVVRQFAQDQCPVCNFPSGKTEDIQAVAKVCSVIIRQAQTILDRTGLPAKVLMEVKQSDGDLDPKLLTDDERSRMMSVFAEHRALKEEIRARLFGSVSSTSTADAGPSDDSAPASIH